MQVLAINASYQRQGTTSTLVDAALAGAASAGAATQHLKLVEMDIRFCTNCLTCYKNLEAEIAPCAVKDDMTGVLDKMTQADGVILASPVHNGFATGLMAAFLERATWRLCRPTGEIMGIKGCPEPRSTKKARAVATLVSAGGMPTELRRFCDGGTPWMMEMGSMLLNGSPVGDIYAGACYPEPLADGQWPRAYLHRRLTDGQLAEARELGAAMAQAIAAGAVKPYDPEAMVAQMMAQQGGPQAD